MTKPHSTPQTAILLGLVLGAAVGSLVNYLTPPGTPWVDWLVRNVTRPVGDLFLNLLFLPIIPLVLASLVLGVARLGGGAEVGRVGLRTLSYFLITTAIAAVLGLTLVNLIQPGKQLPAAQREELLAYYGSGEGSQKVPARAEFGVQTFVNIVPRNPLKAFVEKDMLAVICTAILIGVALTRIDPDKAKPILDLLEGVNLVTDFLIRLALKLAPVAVFCLIFSTTALFGYQLLVALGAFVLTVLAGLALHQFAVLPILVRTLGGVSPLLFFTKSRGTIVTAFSTSSSSATLPTAMKCAEDDLGVPPAISRFVLPLSASMNHNGTALFEGVTVMFLAQAFNVELDLSSQLLVLLLCVLTATGMAGVPGGSLPLIGMVLLTIGVRPESIAIVMGVDRLLDMCRTAVNVTADLTTAVYVARWEARRLPATSEASRRRESRE